MLGSAKGPPSLAPVAPGSPFLAHGGELLGKGLPGGPGSSSDGPSSSRPGITLPLGSLVRERAAGAHKRSRRGRRDPGLTSSAAGKVSSGGDDLAVAIRDVELTELLYNKVSGIAH